MCINHKNTLLKHSIKNTYSRELVAVSYTHLDVYKRQSICTGKKKTDILCCKNFVTDHTIGLDNCETCRKIEQQQYIHSQQVQEDDTIVKLPLKKGY